MSTKFGQNFLIDSSIAQKIIKSANLSPFDNILEIGPGKGILTQYLVPKAGRILAVEIDKSLAGFLRKKFKNQKNLEIIEGDILKINLPKIISEREFKNYKAIGNLPYYITSPIIRLLLETKYPPRSLILTIQKEVAERVCAPKGKESLLSISVKFYSKPKILLYISSEKFNPAPKVDSAVIKLERKREIPEIDTRNFFSLVRAGFCSKRKQLINNLTSSFKLPKKKVSEKLKKAGIEPTQRAQELELENWLKLYEVWFYV